MKHSTRCARQAANSASAPARESASAAAVRNATQSRKSISPDSVEPHVPDVVLVISTLFLEAVGGNLYLRTAADNSVLGLTATQLRDELSVYTKAQVDSLLAGKATAGHTHGISLYTGTAGDPAHEHLVEGSTGFEQ